MSAGSVGGSQRAAPIVLGHRGAPRVEIENTMSSLLRALELGAAGIECDLQLTADGQVVIFHDDDLLRLADRPDRIDASTSEALARIDLGGGRHIPTLAELLAAWPAAGWLDLELKAGGEPLARAVVAAVGARPNTFISSFDVELLRAVAATGWAGPRWLLLDLTPVDDAHGFAEQAQALDARGVIMPAAVCSAHVVDTYFAAGLGVGVWGGRDAVHERELATLGLTWLITDEPRGEL